MPQVLMPLSQPATERSTDRPSPAVWHIITCEYPPTLGGVSDYTYLVAKGLASEGDEVHVWCPGTGNAAPVVPGVTLHAVAGFSILDLKNVGRSLDAFSGSRRILVQW